MRGCTRYCAWAAGSMHAAVGFMVLKVWRVPGFVASLSLHSPSVRLQRSKSICPVSFRSSLHPLVLLALAARSWCAQPCSDAAIGACMQQQNLLSAPSPPAVARWRAGHHMAQTLPPTKLPCLACMPHAPSMPHNRSAGSWCSCVPRCTPWQCCRCPHATSRCAEVIPSKGCDKTPGGRC